MKNDSNLSFNEFIYQYFDKNEINPDKIYKDLLIFFSETEKSFILRKHSELKNQGLKNKEIFKILMNEISSHLFKGQILTERQIKRIIYKE